MWPKCTKVWSTIYIFLFKMPAASLFLTYTNHWFHILIYFIFNYLVEFSLSISEMHPFCFDLTKCKSKARYEKPFEVSEILSWSIPWMCTSGCTFPGFWPSLDQEQKLWDTWHCHFVPHNDVLSVSHLATAYSQQEERHQLPGCATHSRSLSLPSVRRMWESIKQRKVQICTNSCRRGGSETKIALKHPQFVLTNPQFIPVFQRFSAKHTGTLELGSNVKISNC